MVEIKSFFFPILNYQRSKSKKISIFIFFSSLQKQIRHPSSLSLFPFPSLSLYGEGRQRRLRLFSPLASSSLLSSFLSSSLVALKRAARQQLMRELQQPARDKDKQQQATSSAGEAYASKQPLILSLFSMNGTALDDNNISNSCSGQQLQTTTTPAPIRHSAKVEIINDKSLQIRPGFKL
ncbi:uncharacterized protein LOC107006114 [Solanum pennellii]|uniref:Uncharacterized protein LOC107006114 n=1 Tax=Solanum pennellii TaxID=28526 RepID=A0ABM1FQK1_SOLPN|nr:uncharacterized protein LOC107006114 [Solanum pennellii]